MLCYPFFSVFCWLKTFRWDYWPLLCDINFKTPNDSELLPRDLFSVTYQLFQVNSIPIKSCRNSVPLKHFHENIWFSRFSYWFSFVQCPYSGMVSSEDKSRFGLGSFRPLLHANICKTDKTFTITIHIGWSVTACTKKCLSI